jgi:hypothetical protein
MWGHFRSRFFFPPDFCKGAPRRARNLFKSLGPSPAMDPYLRHVIARNQHETGGFAAQDHDADPSVSRH